MVSLSSLILALAIGIIGVGYTSYRIGIQRGAEATVQHLIDEGILTFEEDSDS